MTLNKDTTACFTGHRRIARGQYEAVADRTEKIVRVLINRGYDTFLVGGAIGYDTLAQQVVLRLREEIPYLRIVMAIPCEDQDARWNEADRRTYRMLREQADETVVLSPVYTDGCMLARNRFMVEHSSVCIACYNGSARGGTAYTVRYASARGLLLYNAMT